MKHLYITSTAHNFSQRQTAKGKVWDCRFYVYDIDGIRHQKKLSGYRTKTAAAAAYTDWVRDNAELVSAPPAPAVVTVKGDPTLSDLLPSYFAHLRGINKDSVIYEKKSAFALWITPHLGDCTLDELTVDRLRAWQKVIAAARNPRTGAFYTVKYISKVRGFLSAFLSWASDEYGTDNLMRRVPPPAREDTKRSRIVWTVEDFARLEAVVDDPTYRALFVFAFYTGRRLGELLALAPEDVGADKIYWHRSLTKKTLGSRPDGRWEVTETKERKEQRLPYSDKIREVAEYYKPATGAQFYFGGDRPLAESTVGRKFHEYTEAAGLPRIRFHDLRHSFASRVYNDCQNIFVTAELIGDTPEQVQRTYGHAYETAIAEAIRKL